MLQFLVKRFIGLIFVLFFITLITFTLGRLAPGDPIAGMLGQHYTQALYIQLRHSYGLDRPWIQQFLDYIGGVLHFDFGMSFQYRDQAVWDLLRRGAPITLELGLWALVLQIVIGIPLGIISALRANTWIDTTNMVVLLILYAVPVFVIAPLVQLAIVQIDINTGAGWPVANWGNAWQYSFSDIQLKLIPILVYATTSTAYVARLMRTSMLEVLRQDYVRTARAKGMREQVVTYRHALRNALIPLVTIIGVSIGFLVTGAFFIERIFNIPGIAGITLNSISTQDYPVIQATTILLAVMVVLGNLLSDILYTVVDPRIKAA
jgi:ABC-type dipeptide/oligopeptide/nickel transport system permease component